MQWNPPPTAGDDVFAAFPGHQRSRSASNGSPWPAARNLPPTWVPPPSSAPPPWANSHPRSPTLAWNTSSPFRNPMELNNNSDPWNESGWGRLAEPDLGRPAESGWDRPAAESDWGRLAESGWDRPAETDWGRPAEAGWGRPTESAFGQPMTPGFFGSNAGPSNGQNPWNGMVRSTSERTPAPAAPPPWAAQSPGLGWDIPRPKSAIGPGRPYPPSPSIRSTIPAHLIPDTWDESNLARRPRDWRMSYNPRASFLSSLSVLPSVLKNQSDVQEYTDPTKRRLSRSLEYHAGQPPISHDLRIDPFSTRNPILHAQTSTNDYPNPFSELDMAQFATTPQAKFLRLFHPKLPWYIDIHQSFPNGVTVGDILTQMYGQLGQQILPRHFWNDVLNEKDRKDIGKAYRRRTGLLKSGAEHGILWIDFLCGEVIFEGFVRHKGGLWEIKTRNAYL
ncbi:hypothetical protein D9756_004465 [Leucocoprinus leucothites]|uniref:DUF6699 domain-containing protein n=1 Tax=Leucocoprinus leucothites TaxID=201217 RepID=A0A8H5GA17_9AGAR|nr:hypothetical protein D9756_004465 [Leucoagaricus leucothites]